MNRTITRIFTAATCAAVLAAGPATLLAAPTPTPVPATRPAGQPAAVSSSDAALLDSVKGGRGEAAPTELQGVGVTQKLNNQVPLNLSFRNEEGEVVKLGDYFGNGRPVVLQLAYFECPMLCGLVAEGMMTSLKGVDLKKSGDFDLLTVSINPNETPSEAKAKRTKAIRDLGKPAGADDVHFLVGDERDIRELADAVGFNYKFVPSVGQFSHPAVIMVMTDEGKVSNYLYGVRFDPKVLTDSIANAKARQASTPLQAFILTCFHVGDSIAKYTGSAFLLMRFAGIATMLAIAGTITAFIVREKRRNVADEAAEGADGPGAA